MKPIKCVFSIKACVKILVFSHKYLFIEVIILILRKNPAVIPSFLHVMFSFDLYEFKLHMERIWLTGRHGYFLKWKPHRKLIMHIRIEIVLLEERERHRRGA